MLNATSNPPSQKPMLVVRPVCAGIHGYGQENCIASPALTFPPVADNYHERPPEFEPVLQFCASPLSWELRSDRTACGAVCHGESASGANSAPKNWFVKGINRPKRDTPGVVS